jgi:hypothetical protein
MLIMKLNAFCNLDFSAGKIYNLNFENMKCISILFVIPQNWFASLPDRQHKHILRPHIIDIGLVNVYALVCNWNLYTYLICSK